MTEWIDIAVLLIGFILSWFAWAYRHDKIRQEKFVDTTNKRLVDYNERIVRVEAEIVTEREVREVLYELIEPFTTVLDKIEGKQDLMATELTDIKVSLAKLAK